MVGLLIPWRWCGYLGLLYLMLFGCRPAIRPTCSGSAIALVMLSHDLIWPPLCVVSASTDCEPISPRECHGLWGSEQSLCDIAGHDQVIESAFNLIRSDLTLNADDFLDCHFVPFLGRVALYVAEPH